MELKNVIPLRGSFIPIDTQDEIWNSHTGRHEWILGIRSNSQGLLMDVLRV